MSGSPPAARRRVATHPTCGWSWSPSSSPPPTCVCSPTSGSHDIAENRHQEAEEKAAECADLPLTWHFIGGLQSNKAAAVARYAHVVHSVDRRKLVGPLNKGAHERSHPVDVLLQVSLDPPGTDQRSGADPEELDALADAVEEAGMLRLRGLMAVAPLGEDPQPAFARLARIRAGFLESRPGSGLVVRGDERRPGGGRGSRRDTRTDRLGGPRIETGGQVVSRIRRSVFAWGRWNPGGQHS